MNFKIKHILFISFTVIGIITGCSGSKSVRHAEKSKENLKRDYEKARKKEIKHRFEIQTDATKKQMKDAHKRANNHNKTVMDETTFLKKLFRKKKIKK